MRASLPLALSLVFAPLAFAAACSPPINAQPAARPETASNPPSTTTSASEPAPSEPAQSPAPTTTAEPAPSQVECTKDEACSEADAGPPPLRAGKGTDPFAAKKSDAAAKSAPACTKDTLKKQLQGIVDACRNKSGSICGDLVLHTASGDAGKDNVSVDFNLGTSENTLGFSKCVVGKINSVRWECAMRGDDIRLDLGCKL